MHRTQIGQIHSAGVASLRPPYALRLGWHAVTRRSRGSAWKTAWRFPCSPDASRRESMPPTNELVVQLVRRHLAGLEWWGAFHFGWGQRRGSVTFDAGCLVGAGPVRLGGHRPRIVWRGLGRVAFGNIAFG